MPSVAAPTPMSLYPPPSPASVLSTAQRGRPIKIRPLPTFAEVISEPGGLMKMRGTIEAIYWMSEVEYDEKTVRRQQRGYPSRYGKHGERCSTVKLAVKHINYRVRRIKHGVVGLCRKSRVDADGGDPSAGSEKTE